MTKLPLKPSNPLCHEHLSHLITKPTKWHVHPAKTPISLGICPVWSESSLSAWRKLGSLAIHWAHSEDWSDWADAQADLSHRWVHMPFCWFCHKAAQFWQFSCFLRFSSSLQQSLNGSHFDKFHYNDLELLFGADGKLCQEDNLTSSVPTWLKIVDWDVKPQHKQTKLCDAEWPKLVWLMEFSICTEQPL